MPATCTPRGTEIKTLTGSRVVHQGERVFAVNVCDEVNAGERETSRRRRRSRVALHVERPLRVARQKSRGGRAPQCQREAARARFESRLTSLARLREPRFGVLKRL